MLRVFVLSKCILLEKRKVSYFSGGVPEDHLEGGETLPSECGVLVIQVDELESWRDDLVRFLAEGKCESLVLMTSKRDMMTDYMVRKILPMEFYHRVKIVEYANPSGRRSFSELTLADIVKKCLSS